MMGVPTAELRVGDTVDLLLTFHDGTRVSAEGANATDHHHGNGDRVVQQ